MPAASSWTEMDRAARVRAALWVAVAFAALAWAVHRAWVSDDIYITFRYSDNVLAGHGPVYNAGERSEGYTHFLWFLLLTLGRALGVPPHVLGEIAGLPFDAGILLLLVRISARLFPGRGGLRGVPVAMVGWALLEDARLFATGGLETAAFTFFLLLGFDLACLSRHPRRGALAGWALAVACLLRPDGLLAAVLVGVYLAWRDRSALGAYAAVGILLVGLHLAFRLAYYGYPLPNPYYAKSGHLAHWAQGWIYARLYFGCYLVLLAAVPGALLALLALRRRRTGAVTLGAAAAPLVLAFLLAAAPDLAVVRGGGDFMFARFFLPTTPFLLLLVESLVHRLPRAAWRLAAAGLVGALVVLGATRKHGILAKKQDVAGIVDEPQFYPDARRREIQRIAASLRPCLEGTGATLLVEGGQASLAYYARYPVAIERYGLTDETIAHESIQVRRRPGHEKNPTSEYLHRRRVQLRVTYRPVRSAPQYTLFALGEATGQIITYDRELMERLKSCPGAAFLDFPRWLEGTYFARMDERVPRQLLEDWIRFQWFYFDHNPDPEGLRDKLRAALAARGLGDLPQAGASGEIFQDAGRPTATP